MLAVTDAPAAAGPARTLSPSTSMSGVNVTVSPVSFSTSRRSPWVTLYCFPPVRMTAYIGSEIVDESVREQVVEGVGVVVRGVDGHRAGEADEVAGARSGDDRDVEGAVLAVDRA